MLNQLWQLCATDKGIVEEQHPPPFTPPKGKVTQSVIRSMGLCSTVLTDQVQLYGNQNYLLQVDLSFSPSEQMGCSS